MMVCVVVSVFCRKLPFQLLLLLLVSMLNEFFIFYASMS